MEMSSDGDWRKQCHSIDDKSKTRKSKYRNFKHILSYGIALCRQKHGTKGKFLGYEVLLIQKRHTYQFVDFVLGRYTCDSNRTRSSDKRLAYLFSHMTSSEKLDILTFDFNVLWAKLWVTYTKTGVRGDTFPLDETELETKWEQGYDSTMKHYGSCVSSGFYIKHTAPMSAPFQTDEYYESRHPDGSVKYSIPQTIKPHLLLSYFQKKGRFETLTGTEPKRKHICELIDSSSNASLIWEIPKGQKKDDETDLDCAIREFTEETQISPRIIRIVSATKPIVLTYRDGPVLYSNTYYIATIADDIKPKVLFNTGLQSSEVNMLHWFDKISARYILTDQSYTLHLVKMVIDRCKKL